MIKKEYVFIRTSDVQQAIIAMKIFLNKNDLDGFFRWQHLHEIKYANGYITSLFIRT